MKKISATLITYNEEAKVGNSLSSLSGIVDEIVVVDSLSTDATEKICRQFTNRFLQREWTGYRDQKQFAAEQAQFDWILSLDADEVVGPELRNEIVRWKHSESGPTRGYYIPRKTFFLGRWIEHTTWFPDWQLRLFHRPHAEWRGGRLHESVHVSGLTDRLSGVLEHHTYASLSEYLGQLNQFSSLAAADYLDAGKRASWIKIVLLPVSTFLSNYLVHRGFMDGGPGFVVSVLSAVSVFFKYLKLWEMQSGLPASAESHERAEP